MKRIRMKSAAWAFGLAAGKSRVRLFTAYAAPQPSGFAERPVCPAKAFYHTQMGEFLLMYDDVRTSDSPKDSLLEFCQSTYEAAADLANWDRRALER